MKKQFITKQFIATLCILAVVGVAVGVGVQADEYTAGVDCTVTPGIISVNLSTLTVNYGVLALSTSDTVRSVAESATITATNNGNMISDFTVKGSNTTGGTNPWTISSDPADYGAVNSDQFAHRFDEGSTFVTGEAAALSSSAYKTLEDDVAISGTVNFILQMNMPTSSTDTSNTKSTIVTVLVTEA